MRDFQLRDYFENSELKDLHRPSNIQGLFAVALTWGKIFSALALFTAWPSVITAIIAVILIGGRQLALAILMHEATHFTLFKNKWLNEFVGHWFCGVPVWQDLPRYRKHHWDHHRWAGSEQDPDISLVQGYPLSKKSFYRKVIRDLLFITGLKRVYGQILMDFEFIKFTVAAEVVSLNHPFTLSRFGRGVRRTGSVMLVQVILYQTFKILGFYHGYLIWSVAYLTTFSLFIRLRSIAEHAGTQMDLDPLKSTRTTQANILARLTVAPHRVNYHLEHHLAPQIPFFNLPILYQKFHTQEFYKAAFVAKSYFEVLKSVVG